MRGTPLSQARGVMIMLHGRGSSAENILSLVPDLRHPEFAYLAPQAAGSTWYPFSFLEPIERNEPYLSSALGALGRLVEQITQQGISTEKLLLLGFSQGACLTLEFAARNATRYGGIAGLSGGLIGPDDTPRDYPGSFSGTPIFLGCSDVDFHIPRQRVDDSAAILIRLGATVTERLYSNMGHTVNEDEITFVKSMMNKLVEAASEDKS